MNVIYLKSLRPINVNNISRSKYGLVLYRPLLNAEKPWSVQRKGKVLESFKEYEEACDFLDAYRKKNGL